MLFLHLKCILLVVLQVILLIDIRLHLVVLVELLVLKRDIGQIQQVPRAKLLMCISVIRRVVQAEVDEDEDAFWLEQRFEQINDLKILKKLIHEMLCFHITLKQIKMNIIEFLKSWFMKIIRMMSTH